MTGFFPNNLIYGFKYLLILIITFMEILKNNILKNIEVSVFPIIIPSSAAEMGRKQFYKGTITLAFISTDLFDI